MGDGSTRFFRTGRLGSRGTPRRHHPRRWGLRALGWGYLGLRRHDGTHRRLLVDRDRDQCPRRAAAGDRRPPIAKPSGGVTHPDHLLLVGTTPPGFWVRDPEQLSAWVFDSLHRKLSVQRPPSALVRSSAFRSLQRARYSRCFARARRFIELLMTGGLLPRRLPAFTIRSYPEPRRRKHPGDHRATRRWAKQRSCSSPRRGFVRALTLRSPTRGECKNGQQEGIARRPDAKLGGGVP
jgi:hypothetical protein